MVRSRLVQDLLHSPEPSIRWRVEVEVLGNSRDLPRVQNLEAQIRRSARVRALMSHLGARNRTPLARNVYYKWQGVHWLLASLVDLGYPRGDPTLRPLIDQALELWLRPSYLRTYSVSTRDEAGQHPGVPIIRGRARRCGSQHGSALRYVAALGWPDERALRLARLLQHWQWPDGGWNCDTRPEADSSSFMETLLPMRGLAAYATFSKDPGARRAAAEASEVFLGRRLFRRRSNGQVMDPNFLRLHFPLYWHYDVLGGLKGITEVGRIRDPRCSEALDWLEEKELPSGGWPADAKYYRVSPTVRSTSSFVDWGPTDRRHRNDWVTTDALQVLAASGRFTF